MKLPLMFYAFALFTVDQYCTVGGIVLQPLEREECKLEMIEACVRITLFT